MQEKRDEEGLRKGGEKDVEQMFIFYFTVTLHLTTEWLGFTLNCISE